MTSMTLPAQHNARHLTWLRCNADRRNHAVTQHELAHGVLTRAGRFPAVCGHTVTPGSMLEPPGTPCPRCAAVATESRVRNLGARHRQGVIRRWLTTVVGRTRRVITEETRS